MRFPEKIYPYLYKLEKMEFDEPKKDTWLFRKEHKHELWKEYRNRLDFIERRVTVFGGNKGVHKIN